MFMIGDLNNEKKDILLNSIVAIGASKGGLDALKKFFIYLPNKTNLSYIIAQSFSKSHDNHLSNILSEYSNMPILKIVNGMRIAKNNVYLKPPKCNLVLKNNVFYLKECTDIEDKYQVDYLFSAISDEYKEKVISIILSGDSSDGSDGIKSIKKNNGYIIVQEPSTCLSCDMPCNAITTGLVDLILSPEKIAESISDISVSLNDINKKNTQVDENYLKKILSIIQNVTNINYYYYKTSTILRHIEKRMVITNMKSIENYLDYLTSNDDEVILLARDIMNGVTNFFRDHEYFERLKATSIKNLVLDKDSTEIKVWDVGCFTGEEAYSIAILFYEVMEELNITKRVNIFATDLNPSAIAFASKGKYQENLMNGVSLSRKAKFFVKKNNSYEISKNIRNMIVFEQHNVFQDPPLRNIDLISCRNLLIYFQPILQSNLFNIFHKSLKNKGYLFLGKDEGVSDFETIFKIYREKEKIFIHDELETLSIKDSIALDLNTNSETERKRKTTIIDNKQDNEKYTTEELNQKILDSMIPACILINKKNEMVNLYGDCTNFIELPDNVHDADILQIIRDDLKIIISTVLKEVRDKKRRIVYFDIPIKIQSSIEHITIVAQPIESKSGELGNLIAISFNTEEKTRNLDSKEFNVDLLFKKHIDTVEKDLNVCQLNLKSVTRDLENTNSKLMAVNEELLSANEELQTTNEELFRVNKELYALNTEYRNRVKTLSKLNNDVSNFLTETLVGTMLVDSNLNILKFTDYLSKEFNLLSSSIGLSLNLINRFLLDIDLLNIVKSVKNTRKLAQITCKSVNGKIFLITISPYNYEERKLCNTLNNEQLSSDETLNIDGAFVITFVDISLSLDSKVQVSKPDDCEEMYSFLAKMSRDLRTPMAAISGMIHLALDVPGIPKDGIEMLNNILISNKYLTFLIDEMFEVSKINSGKISVDNVVISEKDLINESLSSIADKARTYGVNFKHKINDCENKWLKADKEHINRLLVNLLSNAIKFSDINGEVSFDVYVKYLSNGKVKHTYVISDNGKGLSQNFQKTMSKPFKQDKPEYINIMDGTGLSFYITKKYVELLNGTIDCNSQIGKGTVFSITLELETSDVGNNEYCINPVKINSLELLKGKSILVCEDNKINAKILKKLLERKGVIVELALNGQQGIDMFSQSKINHFDAIIMDILMPYLDGIKATRLIRDLERSDALSVPILALTADDSRASEVIDSGMNKYLTKPIEPSKLYEELCKFF
jgi:two-component system CheB/CheR fusion protein